MTNIIILQIHLKDLFPGLGILKHVGLWITLVIVQLLRRQGMAAE